MLIRGITANSQKQLAITTVSVIAAILFFVPLFMFRSVGPIDFWWWMSAVILLLIVYGTFLDRDYSPFLKKDLKDHLLGKIIAGIGAAFLLYSIFFLGNQISRYIFDFAGRNINAVYHFKGDAAPIRIVMLMALIIGPGEELFWRCFLQRRLSLHVGEWSGFIVSSCLYAGVHLASGNIMLFLAALVCGIYWGFLFHKYHSPVINVVSHTVWDIAVFIIFPFAS
jgi:uncharacterized protein